MGFKSIEQTQHGVGRVLAGVAGERDIVVDPAGERPDAVNPAGAAGEVEEGAEAAVVRSLRQEVEDLFLVGEDIGAAPAAGAAGTAGGRRIGEAEGMGKDAAAEPVGNAVQERNPAPAILPGPLGPDDPAQ